MNVSVQTPRHAESANQDLSRVMNHWKERRE